MLSAADVERQAVNTASYWMERAIDEINSLSGDAKNPKPLKVGVLDDLMQDISARNLTIGAGVLKAAIASYTRRIRYKKALAAGGARYDLNGQPCGEVTAKQQNNAEEKLYRGKEEQHSQ